MAHWVFFNREVTQCVQVIKDFVETERRNKKGKTELRLQGLTGHEAAEKVPLVTSPCLGQCSGRLAFPYHECSDARNCNAEVLDKAGQSLSVV